MYSIVIPIYNEEHILPSLINRLKNLDDNFQIILIDDGSTDRSRIILENTEGLTIIKNKINRGKGYSIIKSLNYAKKENILLIDGDLEIDINQIPKLIKTYESLKVDVLIGSRWGINSTKQYSLHYIGNFIISLVFSLMFKKKYIDVLCCVRVLKTELLKSLNLKSYRFSFEVETLIKLIEKQANIEEIVVAYNRRNVSEGKKLKFSDAFGILWTMFKLKFLT